MINNLNLGQGHQQKRACSLICKILNAVNNVVVGGIFCGLGQGFDCVHHDILLYTLKFYGIASKSSCFNWMLSHRYQRVIININYNASLFGVE